MGMARVGTEHLKKKSSCFGFKENLEDTLKTRLGRSVYFISPGRISGE
jgi:hypothetical protein